MLPFDRRRFLRRMLAVLAVPVVGCAETDDADHVAAPGSLRSPARRPTPEPSTEPPPEEPSRAPSREPSAEPSAAPSSEPPSEPASGAVALTVICRDAWGARPAGALTPHTVRQMTLHHTAVPLTADRDAPGRLRRHQGYHQSLGWPDIAYHLGVDRQGNVYELRRPDAAGDTSTDYDPTGHLLVVAEGDYSQQEPTAAQLESVARAFAWGALTFGVDPSQLTGHRDHASTTCPGDALQRRIPELRGRVAELVAAGIERHDVCGAEGHVRVDEIESGG